ncbi:putative WD-40 repeat protein [Streptomyces scabiei 87.22]|uniref:Putative WD-40 repeat protein n=3 Tax=Streptomyces scabiei TaxID=1930 RepID=C9Z6B7_STRSW|nr:MULTISPECIES: helix-turn-helix domain-containing protein [Streptomyces]MBP5865939.1 helix-turn-helix domain-containing protein [Streptomyces sp. LBUM 1484]MBP5881010.1 helix-turn-helix domain-containing protein [Streptomyces sp. LBUM 1487]MBP5896772.1 helix-turn-helix domain-containing protein [Streptomyces sp. LBUM 1488]MBP5911109.1 helix-turn-helix domain-containing protein [Streptomyces sp. LBUM 1486]MDW8470389.1 helix-turn-helix domain-containing protein [Streptomyces scabiei]
MGRREKPVDPDAGPVQRLAHELRLLREKAGKPPYREMAQRAGYSTTALSQAAAGGDQLPTLAVVRAYAEALDADPDEWEARWREADTELRAPAADERAPFRGLARFEPADSDLFFGRQALIGDLLDLARAHRFAAVFGPSGSGKSSLLRAGLVPLLREGKGDGRPAVIRVLTPGARPAHTHREALVPKDGELDTWVIVDQFEELFTLCHDREERDRFLDALLVARRPESRLRVVVAVRGDFYGHCAEHRELAEAVGHASLLVGPMSADELREVVTGPAATAGLNVERVLTARIVEEAGDRPGALPMLSHALLETWRRRRGRTLTLAGYEESGGVRGAIAATAEQVYGDLDEEQARRARRILLRLIAPGDRTADTRRPASRSELGPGAPDVLERLAAARLVTLDGDTVELAHEALITGWPRLAGWIEESRERLRAQRLLGEAARAWEELHRDTGALYRGARLARAEELFGARPETEDDDDLTGPERAFLTASAVARDTERDAGARAARRTRALAVGVCVFLVLALTAGLVAWQRDRLSEEEAAKAAARRLATVAESLRSTDPRTASLLGAAAWRIAPLTESRSALLGALAQPERDAFTDPQTGRDVRRFLTDQGRTLLRADGSQVTRWSVAEHRRTGSYHLPGGTEAYDIGPDARFLLLNSADADSDMLWNLPEARSAADLGDAEYATAAPDGTAYLTRPFDRPGRVEVRRTDDGHVLFGTDVARALTTTALGPGGRLAAFCSADGPPQVWDVVHGKQLPGDWDNADGTVCGTGSGADSGERLLRLSPDGRRLAAVHGTTVTVWDVRGGRSVADFASGGTTGFTQADLSPDGEFLATVDDHEIAVWGLASGGGLAFHRPLAGAEASDLTWVPDHGRRTLRYLDRATVRSLDLTDRLTTARQNPPADATLLGPDGTTLATVTRAGKGYRFELRSTDTPAHPVRRTLGPLPSATRDETPLLAFSPDGRTLAVADTTSSGGSLRQRFTLWNARDHTVRTVLTTSGAADRPVSAIALGPAGRTLLAARSASDDSGAEVWDTRTHRRSGTLHGVSGPALAVRPDGRLLVDSGDQYAGLPTGKVTGRALADGRQVTALAFTPDGARLAVGDSTGHVTLWDRDLRRTTGVLTGTADTVPSGPTEAVGALAFSSDGRTLAVGGSEGTLRLWDTAGQRILGGDLPTPGDEIRSLAFGHDDGTLYAAGPNMLLRRHRIAPEAAVRAICARAGGGLTRALWQQYVPDAPYRRICPPAHRPRED